MSLIEAKFDPQEQQPGGPSSTSFDCCQMDAVMTLWIVCDQKDESDLSSRF